MSEDKQISNVVARILHKQAGVFADEADFEFATFQELEEYLNSLGASEIARMMNSNSAPISWFPSGWGTPSYQNALYPGILAQALVKSQANESLTDLTNIYYASHRYSPEAIKIFQKDVLANSSEPIDWITTGGNLPSDFIDLAQNQTSFVKSLLMLMNNKQLSDHKRAIQNRFPSDAAPYFKLMGI